MCCSGELFGLDVALHWKILENRASETTYVLVRAKSPTAGHNTDTNYVHLTKHQVFQTGT
jgi:hypothetical protein